MPNKTLDLTKIKLGKSMVELVYLDFVTVGEDVYTKEVGEKCKAPPTADFKAAVGKLKEFVYKVHPLQKNQVESLEVTQITIKPEDDGMGIVLVVTAQYKNVSRPDNFTTPYVSTLDNSNPLPDSVVEIIDVIKDQAKLYSEGLYEQATLDLKPDKKEMTEDEYRKRQNLPSKEDDPTNKMKTARKKAEAEEAAV